MKAPWREGSGVFPWLILLIVVLGIALLSRYGVISFDLFKSHKDAIETTATIIETLILIVGSIFTYLRFFKGRTLKPKLLIKPSCTVIKKKDSMQHFIDVEIQNAGSVAIWNHRIEITATIHDTEDHVKEVSRSAKLPNDHKPIEHLIDVGESSYEQGFLSVPTSAYAVTYMVLISDHHGTVWDRTLTVKNSESKKE